jgi:ADP-dependent NAD(P)H-hydrate dehydratase / NAD(P)H-hydrate epimerase
MHKVFTAAQIRELDHYTITHEPVSSIDLMERASRSFAEWFVERFHTQKKTGVICGTGNNGGDGLAIARLLITWGYPVKIWVVRGSAPASADFQTNLERLTQANIPVDEIRSADQINSFSDQEILVDALFGSGLSRPVEGLYADVVNRINDSEATVVAVDIPSGLRADETSTGAIVEADYTVTFQFPKLSFFLPQSFRFTGEWTVRDIGLHKEGIRIAATPWFYLSQKGVKRLHRDRRKFDHKGTFGHALLIVGSFGKIGAAILASRAALRAGAGLLTVYVPGCGYTPLQTAVPEAMTLVDQDQQFITAAPETDTYDVVGIGPGLGQVAETLKGFRSLLGKNDKPLVVDADALNILASNRELMHLIPPDSILTPHPKEFERLVGTWSDDFERLTKQKELAGRLKSVVVLKGAYTSIATPEGTVYFNTTGNPGMATGGTGDVLTGILTGLRAQGYDPTSAAIMGVYLHGLAGDLAVRELGMDSLVASDVVTFLPAAFRKLII